jgi:putative endonuclease
MRQYYVYIMSSHSRVLYMGFTRRLDIRVRQHKRGEIPGFTRTYKVNKLVHYEVFDDFKAAIAREKQLKRWPRERKMRLIERQNAGWTDLGASWTYEASGELRNVVTDAMEKPLSR